MKSFTLNIKGEVREYTRPQVMGILNVTPDSFYSGSRTIDSHRGVADAGLLRDRVAEMIADGADFIDVGGYSSRPGAVDVSPREELSRLEAGLSAIRSVSETIPVSVDTFRADVARECVASLGADIINDISGGMLDDRMFETVDEMRVPYIMMHMRGTPATMQTLTDYPSGVTAGVIAELSGRVSMLSRLGVADVIVDPGFGFAKTVQQNYELMRGLEEVAGMLGRPVLVGVSRKSMVYKPLGLTPADALPGTVVLDTLAIERGAAFVRVHDVAAARQTVDVMTLFEA